LREAPKNPKQPHSQWLCQCQCGIQQTIAATNLKRRATLGCDSCARKGRAEIHPINIAFSHVRGNAAKRSISFDLTKDQAYEILKQQNFKCALTQIELDLSKNKLYFQGCNASLDRINSSEGYAVGNVQWVYKPINNMKWKLPQDEFIRLCKLVACNN